MVCAYFSYVFFFYIFIFISNHAFFHFFLHRDDGQQGVHVAQSTLPYALFTFMCPLYVVYEMGAPTKLTA